MTTEPANHADDPSTVESTTSVDDNRVAISVTAIDYTEEWERGNDDGKTPVLHVYGRTDRGRLEHIRVHGFEPYFYAPEREAAGLENEDGRVKQTKSAGKDLHDRRVRKVVTHLPRHVGQLRDDFRFTDEADVRFHNRFLIDKEISSGLTVPKDRNKDGSIDAHVSEVEPVELLSEPREHIVDIEVEDRNGFPEDGEEPITCLTAYDSVLDAHIVWAYIPNADQRVPTWDVDCTKVSEGKWKHMPDSDKDTILRDYEPMQEPSAADKGEQFRFRMAVYSDEAEMLHEYLTFVERTDPDLLLGWNSNDFDYPYLLDRMELLNNRTPTKSDNNYDLSPERFARVGEVWRGGYGAPNIKGRVPLDMLEAYKRTKFTEMESYRLDHVGEVELGVGKETFIGKVGDLWVDDPVRMIEYNVRDVEICTQLNQNEGLIPFWNEVSRFVGCTIDDAPIPGDACDMYVLHKVHGDYILPSKGSMEADEEYEGGAVFDPISGVEEYVNVLDLKSLYPMCMVTINASPETKVENPEQYSGKMYQAPNGMYYQKEPNGIIREMVDELLTERDKKKDFRSQHEPGSNEYERYDRQQASIKVVMNSLYGVLGWDKFRLYDSENAAAVTATGRAVINHTEKVANRLDYKVTYGDTDSVMLALEQLNIDNIATAPAPLEEEHPELTTDDGGVQVPDEVYEKYPDMDDAEVETVVAGIIKGFELEEEINAAYDAFARKELNAEEHRFLIENEKLYRRFFQAGKKKRYAGDIKWKEGHYVDKTDITGFEYKRSDSAPVTNRVQKETIDRIIAGQDHSEIRSWLHDEIEQVREGNVSIEDIGIPSGIGQPLDEYANPGSHPRGALYANAVLETNFGAGSKPKHVYLERVHPDFFQQFEQANGNGDGTVDLPPVRRRWYEKFRKDPDVICFEHEQQVPDEFYVDWDKMVEKTLKGPIERILIPIGISWDEVTSGQTQQALGSFM